MKPAERNLLFYIFLLSFFLIVTELPAQTPPVGQDVGAEAQRTQNESQRKEKLLEKKPVKKPVIEMPAEEEKQPAASTSTFVLKDLKITGATVFQPQDFLPIYQPYLNQKVTYQDLGFIVSKIKNKYKQQGYLTTVVYVPEQEIKGGVVEIIVAEGKMGKLNIEGNKYFRSSLLEKYFHSKKNEILNINLLARDILRLNQSSDLEVKTVISAGKEPQTSDVTLKVVDHFPWHAGFSEDNLGSRLTGRYRSAISLRSSNATGHADTFFLNTLYSGKTFGESLNYTLAIDTYGTKFSLDAAYFKMKLGREYKSFLINGETQIYTPQIIKELYLTEQFQAYAKSGLDIKVIKKKTSGFVTSSDQLRIPFFAFDFTRMDAQGQTTFSPRFNFSTSGFLGASKRNHPTASREGTSGFFFKYSQGLSRMQRMPWESYLTLNSDFQAASHTLPSSEQFQLGGMNSIRGYPEGDYLCDNGGSLNADWVFPMYLIPKSWKLANQDLPLQRQIEPVFFMDLGGGSLKKVLPGEKKNKFLLGLGGGFKVRLKRNFSFKLEWAGQLGDRPTSGNGPSNFYFSFQAET